MFFVLDPAVGRIQQSEIYEFMTPPGASRVFPTFHSTNYEHRAFTVREDATMGIICTVCFSSTYVCQPRTSFQQVAPGETTFSQGKPRL